MLSRQGWTVFSDLEPCRKRCPTLCSLWLQTLEQQLCKDSLAVIQRRHPSSQTFTHFLNYEYWQQCCTPVWACFGKPDVTGEITRLAARTLLRQWMSHRGGGRWTGVHYSSTCLPNVYTQLSSWGLLHKLEIRRCKDLDSPQGCYWWDVLSHHCSQVRREFVHNVILDLHTLSIQIERY